MVKQNIMLSYDLGVDGDYKKLYQWLDEKQARECGDSVCMITYPFSTIEQLSSDDDTRKALQEIYGSLKSSGIEFKLNDRIYVASEFPWKGSKELRGGFVVGKRKPNPWEGYSGSGEGNFDVD